MTSLAARAVTDQVADELREAGTPERAENEKRYLKSRLEHYGNSVPEIGKVAKRLLQERPDISRGQLLDLVQESWRRGVHELRMVAVELLCHRSELLEPADVVLLEQLLREARTWALLDTLAVKVVGPLLKCHPQPHSVLKQWSGDEDFWLRRAVLLSFVLPMRKGEPGALDEFAGFADGMLEEREFFIRKAIGWVLRERSKREPVEVYRWLRPRAGRVSGLTLREASKYLTEGQRAELLQAAAEAKRSAS